MFGHIVKSKILAVAGAIYQLHTSKVAKGHGIVAIKPQ